ncbi:unnamed protein product [Lymnaea stagnalis]|uniref:C-type lectin domain-containing protein n=1 Tax=Lymnaea stagnalis TaxID=6523 RepID=A0AAV2HFA1_LYMST
MRNKHVPFILFLIFISLPVVRSECTEPGAIFSEGTCFLYDARQLSYSDSNDECKSKGGVLAKVKSKTQLLDVTVQAQLNSTMWIGANDLASQQDFVWQEDNTAAPELSLFWAEYQPELQGCVYIYVKTRTQIEAYTSECTQQSPFLCMQKDLMTTQGTTLVISTDQSLMNSTDPTISSTSQTTSTVNTTTKTTASAILSSTLNAKVPIKTLMKCGSNCIEFNFVVILNLCVLKYII